MTLHAFAEYMKYWWKAKNRHGVHSPFVYDFIDHVLLDKGFISKASLINCPSIPLRYENLISRIAAYYHYKTILQPAKNESGMVISIDMLLLNDISRQHWQVTFTKYASFLENNSVLIVTDIHKTAEHTKAWRTLCSNDHVRMSIDLYGIGMLLFKTEFKEKQHFILKY